jgi:hypothetical protein
VAEYAQARFSAFANVHWCIVNDLFKPAEVVVLARAMKSREPWGTLMTSHQPRETGYAFAGPAGGRFGGWSDIVTLQTRDELCGREIAKYRASQRTPVVVEEVRSFYGIVFPAPQAEALGRSRSVPCVGGGQLITALCTRMCLCL